MEVHASEETSAPGTPGVSGHVLGVARYRFRATLGRRWGSYLTLVLLIGLVGGLGMGAIAAGSECASIGLWLRQAGPPASGPGGCRATDRDRTPRRLALNQTRVT